MAIEICKNLILAKYKYLYKQLKICCLSNKKNFML
jgi:hypothetical protein